MPFLAVRTLDGTDELLVYKVTAGKVNGLDQGWLGEGSHVMRMAFEPGDVVADVV